jgi:hypothetical protein
MPSEFVAPAGNFPKASRKGRKERKENLQFHFCLGAFFADFA